VQRKQLRQHIPFNNFNTTYSDMNIIYGLIGATVGRTSGTKEVLIEEFIEVHGIFSRSNVQDKRFKEKG